MTIEKINSIEQEKLTASERAVLAEDRVRWKRMGAGAHLDDWLAYGNGLMIRRRLAMHIAFVNRPEGKGYAAAFKRLMEHDGLGTMDKTSISAVLWLYDDPQHMTILREIRDTMSVGERARLNSPISARQRVEKILRARAGGTEETMRTAPMTILKKQVAEQNRTIADLQERLAAAEHRDGSLFDLKRDKAEDIVSTIVGVVTEHRATAIARGILAHYKKQKPAG
ncbi:MAG: hypothetical protein ACLQF4_09920 [Xanthobacteraceae bacterium]